MGWFVTSVCSSAGLCGCSAMYGAAVCVSDAGRRSVQDKVYQAAPVPLAHYVGRSTGASRSAVGWQYEEQWPAVVMQCWRSWAGSWPSNELSFLILLLCYASVASCTADGSERLSGRQLSGSPSFRHYDARTL